MTFFPIGENVTTKVLKKYSIYCNISDKCHDKGTEVHNCKKRKLFGMSRQSRTPSKVAHVIRTLSFICTSLLNGVVAKRQEHFPFVTTCIMLWYCFSHCQNVMLCYIFTRKQYGKVINRKIIIMASTTVQQFRST